MADIGVSETQFAFAWFHKYMNQNQGSQFNFSFPSLKQEGTRSQFGGYDLRIKGNYFIQFKISEYFLRPSNPSYYTKEINDGYLSLSDYPYFRFKVYNSKKTQQLNNLIRLSSRSGNIVEYVAPIFSDEDQFLTRFHDVNQEIGASFRIEGKSLNKIQAGQNHVVCYNQQMLNRGTALMFSEPTDFSITFSSKSIKEVTERFLDNRDDISFEAQVSIFKDIFEGLNVSFDDSIDTIQMKLLANTGIYWLPLIKT